MRKKERNRFIIALIALLSGSLLTLSFAPFQISILSFIAIGILFFLWFKSSCHANFWCGFLFGLGFFGSGVYWVFISIYYYGGSSITLSFIITALLIVVISLFFAFCGLIIGKFKPNRFKLYSLMPATFTIFEYLRSYLFTGFPWLLVGTSQIDTSLAFFAPLGSVLFISFIVALISSLLIGLFIFPNWCDRILNIIIISLIFLTGFFLSRIDWSQNSSDKLNVTLIQGNIDQYIKWDPKEIIDSFNLYKDLTQQNLESDLIIWPEAAIPLPLPEADFLIDDLEELIKEYKTTLLIGIPIFYDLNYYNGVISLGRGKGRYYKRKLVPFGDYVPFENLLQESLDLLKIPISSFSKGDLKQELITLDRMEIALYICFDVVFANLFLHDLPQADLLVALTNNGWFGKSLAPYQHLQIARMRALENGRFLIFSTNNGPSAIISPKGKIIKKSASFSKEVLKGTVFGMQRETPWMKFGEIPLLLFLFFPLSISIYQKIRTISIKRK